MVQRNGLGLTGFIRVRPTEPQAHGEISMAHKSDVNTTDNPKSPEGPKGGARAQAGGSGEREGGGAPARKGKSLSSPGRRTYLIAGRRLSGITPFAAAPIPFNALMDTLQANSDVEILDTLGVKTTLGGRNDGMPGTPYVIVAKMEESKAERLHQRAEGRLIVELDHPVTLFDAPMPLPPSAASVADAPVVNAQFLVLGKDDKPLEGAEVYLYGTLMPAVGVTSSSGQVTLSVMGDTPQSIRAIHVKARSDYWSFYQQQPSIDTSEPNIVSLKPLSDSFPDLPRRQMFGWGEKAMRLDQLPQQHRGQGVRIAIIDSGVATTHEDLKQIDKGYDVLSKATESDGRDWRVDSLSHGSHCAGTIAGQSENKMGIVGFAPEAEVHVCRIFPGAQISQLIDALEYCVEQQIDIVNLSLGIDEPSEILEQQLARLASLGIACIVAAGNTGGAVQYPALSPSVLAVAAVGRVGEFPRDSSHAQSVQRPGAEGYFSPRFTCFGPEVALCAPGVAILSSVPPNNFAARDGTSMAAAHIAGIAALVLAHHPDFAETFKLRNAQRVARLFQILKASARPLDLGDPHRTGFGMPDVPTALTLQLPLMAPVTQPMQLAQAANEPAVWTATPAWAWRYAWA